MRAYVFACVYECERACVCVYVSAQREGQLRDGRGRKFYILTEVYIINRANVAVFFVICTFLCPKVPLRVTRPKGIFSVFCKIILERYLLPAFHLN